MGLLQDLYNKSGDELDKIEAEVLPPKNLTPEQLEKFKKDQLIKKRIRDLRIKEGRDPDTGKLAGSQSFINNARRS
jgi:hypothetical protein